MATQPCDTYGPTRTVTASVTAPQQRAASACWLHSPWSDPQCHAHPSTVSDHPLCHLLLLQACLHHHAAQVATSQSTTTELPDSRQSSTLLLQQAEHGWPGAKIQDVRDVSVHILQSFKFSNSSIIPPQHLSWSPDIELSSCTAKQFPCGEIWAIILQLNRQAWSKIIFLTQSISSWWLCLWPSETVNTSLTDVIWKSKDK